MVKVKRLSNGTFNIRAVSKDLKKQQLSRDLEKLKADIYYLSETKIQKKS